MDRQKRAKRKPVATPYVLLVPALTVLVVVILIPEIWALLLSFTEYAPGDQPIYIGLRNYVEIIKDPLFFNALLNNLIFLAAVVSLEFLIGLGTALLLSHKFPLQKLWVSLLIAPYAISPVVACAIWKYMLDPSYGIVNYSLSVLGVSPIQWFGSTPSSFLPVIIVDVWKFFPFIMIIAYSAITALPLDIFDASSIDGASRGQTFRFIILPLIKPALFVALCFRLIFAFRTFGIIWILTGGGPGHGTEILSIYLYKESFRYFHFGRGATISSFMLIITFLLSIWIVREMYRRIY